MPLGLCCRAAGACAQTSARARGEWAPVHCDGCPMCTQTLTQMPLSAPTSKEMRFEIYKEVKALSDPLVCLYFEVGRPACHDSALPLSLWSRRRCNHGPSRGMLPIYMPRTNHMAGGRFREHFLYRMEASDEVCARFGTPRTDGRNLPSTGPRLAPLSLC